jgi:3-hydroxyacyl-[acyl-carrier-protein] dehydratase
MRVSLARPSTTRQPRSAAAIGIDRIAELLPHRWPMLLVDRVTDVEPGKKITGVKNVTGNELWFQGHFPRQAVLPGVVVVEAMAQLCGILTALTESEVDDLAAGEGRDAVYLTGLRSVRFRNPVVPGDQLVLTARRVAGGGGVGEYQAVATVDGQSAVEAILTLADPGATSANRRNQT